MAAVLVTIPIMAQDSTEKPAQKANTNLAAQKAYVYSPAGRRDPFRDLLAGREVDKKGTGGIADMSIDDVVLIGIVKAQGNYTGIIKGPEGFPIKIKVGNKFEDGFIVSISESKVVFRKTKERGVPMFRPRDITKELNPEER